MDRPVSEGHNRVAGHRLPRLDAIGKVTGSALYASDFTLPGMLHGRLLRSPHAHARIRRIDTTRAASSPGVFSVVTGRSMPLQRYGNYVKDFEVYATDYVCHVGQAVAGVAAESEAAAAEALLLIDVEYELLPAVFDTARALEPDAPLVRPDWNRFKAGANLKRDRNLSSRTAIRVGDVESAFDRAYRVYEDTFTTPRVHAGYTEPRVAVGLWTGSDDLTVWTSTQLLFDTQNALAEVFGVRPTAVRVIVPGIGGGFGGKLRLGMEPYALTLSKASGRPVRVAATSEEEMTTALCRQPTTIRLKTGVDADGRLLAVRGELIVNTGACSGSGPLVASTSTTLLAGPYRTPNLHLEGLAVYTHTAPTGSVRAPAGPMANFALESQLDIIAADLGIDPLEIRLRNVLRDGDRSATGQIVQGVSIEECLRRAAAAIGWEERQRAPFCGKGIACGWWMTSRGSSSVYLKVTPDSRFTLTVGVVEIGTGALTGIAQLLAEALGVDLVDIQIASGDSLTAPFDFGSQGSRTMFAVGNAAITAAGAIMLKLRHAAAATLDAREEDLVQMGKAFHAGGRTVGFGELAGLAQSQGGALMAEATFNAPQVAYDVHRVEDHFSPAWPSPSFHAHAAEVSVDELTGEITVSRYVVAQDVGYAINPTYLEGQIEGGAIQGLGQAMSEELVLQEGRIVNGNLTDYKMPTAMDAPTVEVILVTRPSEHGPLGAKGAGEPPVIEVPAAIANAVACATGRRIRSLPITAEKIVGRSPSA